MKDRVFSVVLTHTDGRQTIGQTSDRPIDPAGYLFDYVDRRDGVVGIKVVEHEIDVPLDGQPATTAEWPSKAPSKRYRVRIGSWSEIARSRHA